MIDNQNNNNNNNNKDKDKKRIEKNYLKEVESNE